MDLCNPMAYTFPVFCLLKEKKKPPTVGPTVNQVFLQQQLYIIKLGKNNRSLSGPQKRAGERKCIQMDAEKQQHSILLVSC